jgi:hypothetical protein
MPGRLARPTGPSDIKSGVARWLPPHSICPDGRAVSFYPAGLFRFRCGGRQLELRLKRNTGFLENSQVRTLRDCFGRTICLWLLTA